MKVERRVTPPASVDEVTAASLTDEGDRDAHSAGTLSWTQIEKRVLHDA